MAAVKILVIPGSVRTGSFNVRLAAAITKELVQSEADATRISLEDFPLPIYDGDLEAKQGVPPAAIDLKRMIGTQHGVVIVTPEYNASTPPLLKNALDWVSRVRERGEAPLRAYHGRPFAIAAASEGKFGGMRSLMALRQILTLGCGATVIPQQMALSHADQAFDELDQFNDERDTKAMQGLVRALIDSAQRMM
jgi:NAD(P)H-dependent FMN reductase